MSEYVIALSQDDLKKLMDGEEISMSESNLCTKIGARIHKVTIKKGETKR